MRVIRGIDFYDGTEPQISNCILWGNPDGNDIVEAPATYSCIKDGDAGEGNISSDPLFVDDSTADYHLTVNSPCIDAGDPNGLYNGKRDIDKELRLIGDYVDMGADEYCDSDEQSDSDFNEDEIVNEADFAMLAEVWLCESDDPNCWDEMYDLDEDGTIIDDGSLLAIGSTLGGNTKLKFDETVISTTDLLVKAGIY